MNGHARTGLAIAAALAASSLLACDTLMPKRSPGESLYRQRCAQCHGVDGAGNMPRVIGNPYADLTDGVWRQGGDRYTIQNVIHEGVFGKMPGNPDLEPEERRQLADHVLSLRREGG
jgi:mono/diheme cytochrome c family protein